MPAVSPSQGVDRFTWGPSDVRVDLEAHPMHPFWTVDGCPCHVRKPLEGTAVPLSFRSNSLDLRNTSLAMGVTVLLERLRRGAVRPTRLGMTLQSLLRERPPWVSGHTETKTYGSALHPLFQIFVSSLF
jgi:hypothetical protein